MDTTSQQDRSPQQDATEVPARPDHNVWVGLSYTDPHAARAWLRALGFVDGILVQDEGGAVHHSEMLWPGGGRVMVSSRDRADATFVAGAGAATLYVVTEDPDGVWERAQRLGASVVRPMEDSDYGSRGFSIADVEGNSWSFGSYAG
ncbi:MAG: glyoxalase [Intrasporangium sp.]|uniref:VOC family protein n=1 Tax=Intrasporangium sp. TaxID=1925024 RepID=UPI002647BCB2|nr:VOC family protein [Intrasporangium sp.]MDN5796036.1 glyoxalase [Intrasporangium sp.]